MNENKDKSPFRLIADVVFSILALFPTVLAYFAFIALCWKAIRWGFGLA